MILPLNITLSYYGVIYFCSLCSTLEVLTFHSLSNPVLSSVLSQPIIKETLPSALRSSLLSMWGGGFMLLLKIHVMYYNNRWMVGWIEDEIFNLDKQNSGILLFFFLFFPHVSIFSEIARCVHYVLQHVMPTDSSHRPLSWWHRLISLILPTVLSSA